MEFTHIKRIPLVPKIVQWIIRVICSADIPLNVRFGANSILKHNGLGVVLHEKVIIGDNVTIMHNVTLGGRNGRGAPIIEDGAFIGVGACVLGDIVVGRNSLVGANAVVINNVPENSIVGGIPARVLKSRNGK